MESTAASRLAPLFAQYHGRWPQVDLAISTGTTQGLLDALLARTIDCALVADPAVLACGEATTAAPDGAPALDAQLHGVPVFSEQLMLVLPGSHRAIRTPQDLEIHTLAGFARGCVYRSIGEQWFNPPGAAGAPRHLKVLEVGSYHAILACVAAGSCLAVMPQSVLDLQGGGAPQFRTWPLRRVDTLLVSRKSYATPAFAAFAELLAAAAPKRRRAPAASTSRAPRDARDAPDAMAPAAAKPAPAVATKTAPRRTSRATTQRG
jgi:DNA-binding transcriptional LysR family regulator